ncbi:MAG: alpha/beta hydrolase [Prochloraceae cyanobacterium]
MDRKIFGKHLKNTPRPEQFSWQQWIRSLALGTIPAIFSVIPVQAAQTIDFYYGPLGFSIEVDSLELFAKEGKINRQLDFYLSRVKPEARDKFRQALLKQHDVNPVRLYRFVRTPIGEKILTQVGNLINIPGGGNGKYAIRAALGKAAFDSEGLTLLNFLRQFPTDIELNTNNILQVRDLVQLLVRGTQRMEEEIASLSSNETANSTPIDFSKLPDLRQAGKLGYIKQTFTLNDTSRQRQLTVDLYKPQTWREGKTPVVVASHGLASNRQLFEKLGKNLASYGYVVVAPQHPGSDSIYLQDMLQGYYRDVFNLNAFIDRPLDISYVLDELERRNATDFEERLNLESVGLIGHSFGGYTALAIAGAQINFEQLEQECERVIWDPNLSLLLQCRALDLPRQTYDFRDRRVKAIMVFNPVSRSIFGVKGLSQIEIPVFIAAGELDPATPAVIEQIRPFTFLTTSDRYLALLKGQAHVDISQLDAGAMRTLESLSRVKFIDTELLSKYGRAIITGFFEYYIANNADYLPYLQSSYAEYLSEEPFPFYVIGDSSLEALKQAIEDFIVEEGLEDEERYMKLAGDGNLSE